MLRDISTSIYVLKMLRPGQMSPLPPLATPLSSTQNHKFASSYAHSQIYWCRTKIQKLLYWHILQNKNRSCTSNEMLNPVPYVFPSIQFSHTQLLPVALATASKPQLL